MPKIYLPSLQKIVIKDFSLYPTDRKLTYEFVVGVNLIIGGNGMGKTTFLNLVKFALIGLYKKGVTVKRREVKGKEYRIESREIIPYNYFRNRMDISGAHNDSAYVELFFKVNKTVHIVRRRLIDGAVIKYEIRDSNLSIPEGAELNGDAVSQEQYDNWSKKPDKNKSKIESSLQGIYEQSIKKSGGFASFDMLIFLLNDVLFFNEERKTIMWESDFQNTFTALFLIDPKHVNQLEKYRLDTRYYDSLARHKGEDIRALKKVYDRLKGQPDFDKSLVELMDQKKVLQKDSEASFKNLVSIQDKRKLSNRELDRFYVRRNELYKSIEDLDSSYSNLEGSFYSDLFSEVTPKYWHYLKFIKSHGDCPLCNNALEQEKLEKITSDESSCMMCGTNLHSDTKEPTELKKAKEEVSKLRTSLVNTENRIVEIENILEDYDKDYRKEQGKYNKIKSNLRTVDFSIDKLLNNKDSSTDQEFSALKKRMDELEEEKELNSEKSKTAKSKVENLLSIIDNDRIEGTLRLSDIFNKYASKFLGVPCKLVYDDPEDNKGKRYLPRINGIDRTSPEELSESQRFFIDQAFRMSLLSFFNNSNSFLLSETPDASLDISYERNAAAVYLEFIKDPNELVITSNLNNSDFLVHLIKGTPKSKMGHINLLNIGRTSDVQSKSARLIEASETIEKLFNE